MYSYNNDEDDFYINDDDDVSSTPQPKEGKSAPFLYGVLHTVLGPMGLAMSPDGIVYLQFFQDREDLLFFQEKGLESLKSPEEYRNFHLLLDLEELYKDETFEPLPLLKRQMMERVLNKIIENKIKINPFPLAPKGTDFEKKVWSALTYIESGKCVSYSKVASVIGYPKAFRAVASACAKNTIALLIPCHRVVRQNGDLSEYRWGQYRKQILLDLEEGLLDYHILSEYYSQIVSMIKERFQKNALKK
jgi:O-6-methylguanine DNA methyltransferase